MMAAWYLVILVHAGAMSSSGSVALTKIPMESEKACQVALAKAKGPLSPGRKAYSAVCLKTGE